jgi:RNA-directed DNA polymerase
LEEIVHGLGLSLNAEKTRIVDAVDEFDLLRMHFRLKPRRSNPKRLYSYRWPATKAIRSVRRGSLTRSGTTISPAVNDKIRALNPILCGWGQYFRVRNAHRHVKKVDSYVDTKLDDLTQINVPARRAIHAASDRE